ncbi:MAG: hypothetical protein WD200_01005 [Candidatus Andersenbacteria bacterium]
MSFRNITLFFAFLSLLGSTFFGAGQYALAQAPCPPGSLYGCLEAPLPGQKSTNIDDLVRANSPLLTYIDIVVKFVIAIIVVISVISVIAGGFVYMTAGGDASKVALAKTIILSALGGLALALLSWVLLNTISPQFASQLRDPTAP